MSTEQEGESAFPGAQDDGLTAFQGLMIVYAIRVGISPIIPSTELLAEGWQRYYVEMAERELAKSYGAWVGEPYNKVLTYEAIRTEYRYHNRLASTLYKVLTAHKEDVKRAELERERAELKRQLAARERETSELRAKLQKAKGGA